VTTKRQEAEAVTTKRQASASAAIMVMLGVLGSVCALIAVTRRGGAPAYPDASASDAGAGAGLACKTMVLEYPAVTSPGPVYSYDGGTCDPCVRGCFDMGREQVKQEASAPDFVRIFDGVRECIGKCQGRIR